jgi:hypothetical protein
VKAHKTKSQHSYFQSKMNREIIEQYKLKESIMNFNQNEFSKDVKEQMLDSGRSENHKTQIKPNVV